MVWVRDTLLHCLDTIQKQCSQGPDTIRTRQGPETRCDHHHVRYSWHCSDTVRTESRHGPDIFKTCLDIFQTLFSHVDAQNMVYTYFHKSGETGIYTHKNQWMLLKLPGINNILLYKPVPSLNLGSISWKSLSIRDCLQSPLILIAGVASNSQKTLPTNFLLHFCHLHSIWLWLTPLLREALK